MFVLMKCWFHLEVAAYFKCICQKKKQCKYGLKIMCLTDAQNHYLYNAYIYIYIYCGKNSDGAGIEESVKNSKNPPKQF